MPDWKEMYLSLMLDTERAIRILEEGQRKCEELYLAELNKRRAASRLKDGAGKVLSTEGTY